MKITRLEIKDFHQFKDFELDLTYPAGHELVGKPLKKVCFIGQSGTGKTTLLRTILYLLGAENRGAGSIHDPKINISLDISYNEGAFERRYKRERNEESEKINPQLRDLVPDAYYILFDKQKKVIEVASNLLTTPIVELWKGADQFNDLLKEANYRAGAILFLPLEVTNQVELFFKELDKISFDLDKEAYYKTELLNIGRVLDFERKAAESWSTIIKIFLYELLKNENEQNRYAHEITEAMRAKDFEKAHKKTEELEEWVKQNPTYIDQLDTLLSPILSEFRVKIDNSLNYKSLKEKKFIGLQTWEGESLYHSDWSSGTAQIVLKMLSIFTLKKYLHNGIILFDEPENSLYPDIQRILIDYYTKIAPDAQFFFATHSPLIASQFEPWEVVELVFDENGKVQRRNYYEGENHVDNYTIFPQYLRWDSILTHSFGVSYNGNDDFRGELLPKTLRLKKQLAQMEKEKKQDTDEYRQKMETFIKNAKKLGWTEELRTFYEEDK